MTLDDEQLPEYGASFKKLDVEVTPETIERLHVKIRPSDQPRYEVPESIIPRCGWRQQQQHEQRSTKTLLQLSDQARAHLHFSLLVIEFVTTWRLAAAGQVGMRAFGQQRLAQGGLCPQQSQPAHTLLETCSMPCISHLTPQATRLP